MSDSSGGGFELKDFILGANDVHVWDAVLCDRSASVGDLADVLSDGEGERDRRAFVFRRAVLRKLIGRYLHRPPHEIEFFVNENGKPAVSPQDDSPLQFNLAHSATALEGVDQLLIGGEALSVPHVHRGLELLPATQIINGYGPTEGTTFSCCYSIPRAGTAARSSIPIGSPISNTRVYILDQRGSPVPPGMSGELYIGGDGIARGYHRRPELTDQRFIPDPFSDEPGAQLYRTGDRVRQSEGGSIVYLGRFDTQVKIRGFRIEPGEVEACLDVHTLVRQSIVRVYQTPAGEKALVAYVLGKRGAKPITRAELLSHLKARLPDFMIPAIVMPLDTFPLTPSGKVDRQALPEPDLDAIVAREYVAPKTDLEVNLAKAWHEVLKIDLVGTTDDFFELGGNSLQALHLIREIKAFAGVRVDLPMVFDAPTVRGLATTLETLETAEVESEIAIAVTTPSWPVTQRQALVWIENSLYPDVPLNRTTTLFTIKGKIDSLAFEQAFMRVVDHHEALRATIAEPIERLRYCPDVHRSGVIELVDFCDASEPDLAYEAWLKQRCTRSFAAGERLYDAALVKLSEERFVFYLNQHHVITDGASCIILHKDIEAFYLDQIGHKQLSPAELSEIGQPPFSEFADQFDGYIDSPEAAESQKYWAEKFASKLPPLRFFGRDGSERRALARRVRRTIAIGTSRKIHELGRRTPPFIFFTAALFAYLRRVTLNNDICIGVPMLNRPPEFSETSGLFMEITPARVRMDSDDTFNSLLQKVRQEFAATRPHRQHPVSARVAGYDIILNYRTTTPASFANLPAEYQPTTPLSIAEELAADKEPSSRWAGREALKVTIEHFDGDGEFIASFDFNRGIWPDPAGQDHALAYFVDLMDALLEDHESQIDAVDFSTPDDSQTPLPDIDGTPTARAKLPTVPELLAAQAKRRPNHSAVVFEGQELTYAELNSRVEHLSSYLRARGVGPDTLVGVCVDRSTDVVVALIAAMHAGAAYLPIDPEHPASRIELMLADADPMVLLSEKKLCAKLGESRQDRVVLLDDDMWQTASIDQSEPRAGELAYVIFTSGSTGRPKGMEIAHQALSTFLHAMTDQPGMRQSDHLLAVTTISFDPAALDLFLPLTVGATLHIAPRWTAVDAEQLATRLEAEQITVFQATPTTFQMLVAHDWPGRSDLKVLCGGEELPRGLADALLPRVGELWNTYGTTETTVNSIIVRVRAGSGVVPIGRPIPGTRCYILNDHLRPVPPGVPGELFIAGAGLARGYLADSKQTEQRFLPDLFSSSPGARMYRTGDRARIRPDGEFECLGRIDFQLKIRGYRIEPGEIETCLNAHPAVRECVVTSYLTAADEKSLVAYVVAQTAGEPIARSTVVEHLKGRLPEYMIPATVVQLDEFPLTPSGKVDRQSLPAPNVGAIVARDFVAPETDLETAIAGAWRDVLQIDRAGTTDNFFELGGSSLLMLRLLREIERTTGIRFLLETFFGAPTIKGLVATLASTRAVPTRQTTIKRVEKPGPFAASHGQYQMWIEQARDPDSIAYNVPVVLDLDGPLDVSALERGLNNIVARHDALRTSFRLDEGSLVQVVAPEQRIALPVMESRKANGASDQFTKALREEVCKSFDLNKPPLLRARLFKLADDRHTLCVTFHHIIVDEWSLDILFRELGVFYRAEIEGGNSEALPDLTLRYVDFAEWQRERTQSDELAGQLDYWAYKLDGATVGPDLPADYPRPSTLDSTGGEIRFDVLDLTIDELEEHARQERTTLFTVLFAAFHILLFRYSGQTDLIVGTPAAQRDHPDLQDLVGYFLNTLPIRSAIAERTTFREFLQRFHDDCREAIAHQEIPFQYLVERLKPARDQYGRPLFQTMFALIDGTQGKLDLPGVRSSVRRVATGTTKADLMLLLSPSGDLLQGRIEFATGLFKERTVHRFAESYCALLRSAIEAPDCPIEDLPLLSDHVRTRIIAEQAANATAYPRNATIVELFEQQASERGGDAALAYGGETWTYDELNRHANQIAQRLRSMGVDREVLVGICADRSPGLIAGILGILKAGGAYVPLDPGYPQERLAFMLADTKSPILLADPGLLDDAELGEVTRLELTADQFAEESAENPQRIAQTTDLAYVMYTSGSTGTPKGVEVTHRNIVRLVRDTNYADLGPGVRILQVAPNSFDAATFEIWGALLNGGLCVLYRERTLSLEVLESELKDQQVNCMFLTTSLFNNVIDEIPDALANVDQLYFGGEAASVPHVLRARELLPDSRLFNIYGPTEGTTFSCYHPIPHDDAGGLSSIPIGKPISNTTVYVLDEHRALVPSGMPGELYIGGDGVVRGYHQRPELTAERFVADPFSGEDGAQLYRTGDRVRQNEDGSIVFLGRFDSQVKIRGFRIEPGEVEAFIDRHEAVRQSAVETYQTPAGEKALVAYVVAEEAAASIDRSAIVSYLKPHLPDFMIPSTVVQLDAFPLSPTGKIDRLALPEPHIDALVEHRHVAPATDLEIGIAAAWQEVLKVDRVGITDDFFELGGSSLSALQLVREIEQTTGFRFDLPTIFSAPTVKQLVMSMESGSSKLDSVVVPLQKQGDGRPYSAFLTSDCTNNWRPVSEPPSRYMACLLPRSNTCSNRRKHRSSRRDRWRVTRPFRYRSIVLQTLIARRFSGTNRTARTDSRASRSAACSP